MESEEGQYIHVAVKIRPLNQREISNKDYVAWNYNTNVNCIYQIDEQGRSLVDSSFAFDSVFGENTSDEQVYQAIFPPLLKSFLSGVNSSLITYGVTSSGMTRSLYGIRENSGLISLVINDLISQMQNNANGELSMSYIEIYKENVVDLLKPNKILTIHENSNKGIYVEATRISFSSIDEFSSIFEQGKSRRHISPTDMNSYSSRSHTILYILFKQTINNKPQESLLQIVDLAGAQHIRNTGATGVLLDESKKINLGLLAFTRVIRLLQSKQDSMTYMGFRDSRLTRLLQSSLDGSCHTSLLLCMTPASSLIRETRSVLNVATQIQSIAIAPCPSSGYDPKTLIHRLQGEVLYLRNRMKRSKPAEMESVMSSVFTRVSDRRESMFDLRSEAPTICQEFDLGAMERENEQLKLQLDVIKQEQEEAMTTIQRLKGEEAEKNQLMLLNKQLLQEIAYLRKENEELRKLNELYTNNSKNSEEEHSILIKEVTSLRSELNDCEEAAAHFSSCISEMEKFLSTRV